MRLLIAALAFACAVAVIGIREARVVNTPGNAQHSGWGLMDFRDEIYYPARALRDGVNPYDTKTYVARYPVGNAFAPYVPHHLLLALPFGFLPFTTAEVAYMAVMIAVALAVVALAFHLAGRRPSPADMLFATALVLLSRPGQMNALLGQATLFYVVGVYVALGFTLAVDEPARRPWLAAFGLALAAAKPTYGFPIAALLFARGDRTVAIAGIALAAVLCAPVLLELSRATPLADMFGFVAAGYESHSGRVLNAASTSLFRIDATALLSRLAGRSFGFVGDVAVGCAVLGAAAWTLRRHRDADPAISATVVIVAMLLCTYHQPYDLVVLVWPIVAVATRARVATGAHYLLLALLALPFANFLATESTVDTLGLAGPVWMIVASFNAAALAAAFILSLALARRAPQTTPFARSRSSVASSIPISA